MLSVPLDFCFFDTRRERNPKNGIRILFTFHVKNLCMCTASSFLKCIFLGVLLLASFFV